MKRLFPKLLLVLTLVLLTGQLFGAFELFYTSTDTYHPYRVAWGDYDNDGYPDVAVSNTGASNNIYIYRYDSSGSTFTLTAIIPAGDKVQSVAWGDYNNDGKLDLLCSRGQGASTQLIKVFRNEGSSIFTEVFVSTITGQSPKAVWGDFNNDGWLDIAVANNVGNNCIYRNDKSTFTLVWQSTDTVSNNTDMVVGDMNNDGFPDIIVSKNDDSVDGSKQSRIYIGDGNFNFYELGFLGAGVIRDAYSIAVGDYDNDGDLDIFLGVGSSASEGYKNNGDGTFTNFWSVTDAPAGIDISLADYDNDGYLDVMIADYNGSLKIYKNNGDNTIATSATYSVGVPSGAEPPGGAFGDFNSDGKVDIALAAPGFDPSTYPTARNLWIYKSTASVANTAPNAPTALTYEYYYSTQTLVLSWNDATDVQTPSGGLYYAVRVGTKTYVSAGDDNILSGAYGTPLLGNFIKPRVYGINKIYLRGLPTDTTFYWSVKTIDAGLMAGNWATEATANTIVPPATITDLSATTSGAITDGEIILTWTSPGDDGTVGNLNGKFVIQYTSDTVLAENPNWWDRVSDYVVQIPTSATPGVVQSYKIGGLIPGVSYYFRLWSADEINAFSPISNGATVPASLVPPGPITDLTVNPGNGQALLTWTAPGNDGYTGNITGGVYEIHWATYVLTDSNFDSVPVSTRTPYYPSIPRYIISSTNTICGAQQTVLIGGLVGTVTYYLMNGVTYYFAIKTQDQYSGNWSSVNTNNNQSVGLPKNPGNVVISQIATRGPVSASDEFVELYNRTENEIDISNWTLQYKAATALWSAAWSNKGTISAGTVIKPHGYYLIANTDSVYSSSNTVPGDLIYNLAISDGGHLRIVDSLGNEIDLVGYGTCNWPEGGVAASTTTGTSWSIERNPQSPRTSEVAVNSWVNGVDFSTRTVRQPHNSLSSPEPDNIPPAAISNLTALAGASDGDIILTWTAPGDDGTRNNTNLTYVIRYATANITNFDSPPQPYFQTVVSTPVGAGIQQQYTLTGLNPGTTYYVAIKTSDEANNWSTWSTVGVNDANFAPAQDLPPNSPTDLTVVSVSSISVSLRWTESVSPQYVQDISGYNVYLATYDFNSSGDNGVYLASYTVFGATEAIVYNLRPEVTYYFRVAAVDRGDSGDGLFSYVLESSLSVSVSSRTLDVPPSEILDLSATPSADVEGAICLNWTTPGDDGTINDTTGLYDLRFSTNTEYATSEYQITFTSYIVAGQNQKFTVTGLTDGVTYYFWIKFADEVGNWSGVSNGATSWAQQDIFPPGPVTDLVAAPGASKEIVLTWTAPGDNGYTGTATTYIIKYATSEINNDIDFDSANPITALGDVFTPPTPKIAGWSEILSLTGLPVGVTYYFAIKSVDELGQISPLDSSSPRPGAAPITNPPYPFSCVRPIGGVVVTTTVPTFVWQETTDPDGDNVWYELTYSSFSNFSISISSAGLVLSTFTALTDLTDNTTYWWKVRAYDDSNASRFNTGGDQVFIVNVYNDSPTAFSLFYPSNTITSLNPQFKWQASSDVDPFDSVKYELQYSSYPDFSYSTKVSNLTDTSYTPTTNLQHTTVYYWRVRAYDLNGGETYSATWSFTTIDLTAPDMISGVSAVDYPEDSGGSILVSWQQSLSVDVAGYCIYYAYQQFSSTSQAVYYSSSPINNPAVSSWVVSGLVPDIVDYYFAVAAIDYNGNLNPTVISTGPVRAVSNYIDTTYNSVEIKAGFDPKTSVYIPKGSNSGIAINILATDPVIADKINAADEKLLTDTEIDEDYISLLADTLRIFKSNKQLSGAVKITIPYSDSIPEKQAQNLRIVRLNEERNIWEVVRDTDSTGKISEQSVDKVNRTVSAWVNHFSAYKIVMVEGIKDDLSLVEVYPNPFRPAKNSLHDKIIFRNLTANAEVKIFTLSGDLVKVLRTSSSDGGKAVWQPVSDENNQAVVSGLYIYIVTDLDNPQNKKVGKLVISR